jgi:hypothetical protein
MNSVEEIEIDDSNSTSSDDVEIDWIQHPNNTPNRSSVSRTPYQSGGKGPF